MKMQKIIIMDFSVGEVHIFSYDPNVWENGEHFLTEHFSEQGTTFKEQNCQWMIVTIGEEPLPIYIH
jgi:hypothetical protein